MTWVFRRPFDYRPKLGSSIFALLSAASAASGSAAIAFSTAGTIGATGALAGTASISFANQAVPASGDPNAAIGSASITFSGAAQITGDGALLGSAAITFSNSAAPLSIGSYKTHMWPMRRRPLVPRFDHYQWAQSRWTIFPYSVSTATAGIASIAFQGNATPSATGRLQGVCTNAFSATASTAGAGALTGSVAITFTNSGTIVGTASGEIAGDGGVALSVIGTLTGTGALRGIAPMQFTNFVAPSGLPPSSASCAVTFSASGTMYNSSAGAHVITAMSFTSTDGLRMYFTA